MMNKVILMGRISRDTDTRFGTNNLQISRYGIAVERAYKKDGEANADFINCIAFGKQAEFAEKYLRKGMKVAIEGRIQTGSYKNKDGNTVYTTDVIVDRHEFCESRNQGNAHVNTQPKPEPAPSMDGFVDIPDGIDEELPFS